ncbi:MAG: efflux RND transporter periplasmic adaptor subunit [Pseudomonadota bacterium]
MSPRNLLHRAALAVLIPTIAVLSGCNPSPQQGGGPGGGERPAPEVEVVSVTPQRVTLTRELPGRVHASVEAQVRPQVNGIVRERRFEEGGTVAAGEVLYQLNDDLYRALYNSAVAARERARATLESARLRAERSAELVKSRVVSQQDYDDAQAALLQARAELQVAEAAVESAEVDLDYTRITAPVAGHIGRSAVTRGALVTANQAEPLATIQQLDPLYLDLNQPSSEMLQLRKAIADGTLSPTEQRSVKLLLEDGSAYGHEGRLAFSEVNVDPSTGSFTMRVIVPNPEQILMPGMYLRAEVVTGVREQALLVPQQAVSRTAKGEPQVMVVGDENKVEARPIRVSRTVDDQWLVEEGLEAGERLILKGLQKVKPGATVRVAGASDDTDAE